MTGAAHNDRVSVSARIAAVDLNGQLRGKRIPAVKLGQPIRMPLSALNVDIFGYDIDDSPLVFQSGDADGTVLPTEREPLPLPWLDHAPPLQLSQMYRADGAPFEGDPRHALARILTRFEAHGWYPQCAVELEFYLTELDGALAAPVNPAPGRRVAAPQVLGLRQVDGFERFFNDIESGAAAMGLAPITITSESGLGQFEVTLDHGPAMKAADDALLMKELIKGTARNHGFSATFLPKPFKDDAGSGLHLHASILDAHGINIFDETQKGGSERLESAIAGTLSAIQASTLFFAPHLGSYARFVENAHAPTTASWGYDNRTVALRVPSGPPIARRFEHRVAGGDTNPYLLFSVILGAALQGIEAKAAPLPPTKGNAYDQGSMVLAPDMRAAIDALNSPALHQVFDPLLLDNLARTKRQDLAKSEQLSETELTLALLDLV